MGAPFAAWICSPRDIATVGGFGLWKLVSATWQAVAGFNGGLRVAVDSAGNPVVVDKSGIVSFYQPSSNAWQSLS